jgi:hypothetical protein
MFSMKTNELLAKAKTKHPKYCILFPPHEQRVGGVLTVRSTSSPRQQTFHSQ